MILDAQNLFDQANAITVTRNSTNVIDLVKTGLNIGLGRPFFIYVTVTTAFTADGAATLQVALVTDDNASLSSLTTLQDLPAVIAVASLVAGFSFSFYIHPTSVMEQYLGLIYTVATGPMTAGKVTAGIALQVPGYTAYPRNYPVA